MPSFAHEGLIELFRNRPELAPELLRDALHIGLPVYSKVRIESADLPDLDPAERRADLVLLLVDGEPVLGIVVEVQLQEAARKRFTWPAYVCGLRARLKCPACFLVVTPDESVANWCRKPIEIGPGNVFVPLVIGPASVPIIDDAAAAERDPELVVLSVMAHGHEQAHAEALGRTALRAIQHLPEDRHALYSDLVLAAVSNAVRAALEELMASGNYEFQSDFVKKFLAKGEAEGEAKGEAKALIAVLEARGVRVSDEARARILACTEAVQLEAWLRKAATATTLDEVF
jgi:hypothetical protein